MAHGYALPPMKVKPRPMQGDPPPTCPLPPCRPGEGDPRFKPAKPGKKGKV